MEEKLREGRQPVQELLRNDCVQLGLIDRKQAERLIRGMLGKQPEVAEQDVVEVLRQILQDQVKGIIRRLKGGPWATPQAQEEMRQDIHHARSVRAILMFARQVIKERRAWKKKHGKGCSAACSVDAGDWADSGCAVARRRVDYSGKGRSPATSASLAARFRRFTRCSMRRARERSPTGRL